MMSLAIPWALWSALLFGQAELLPPVPFPLPVPRLQTEPVQTSAMHLPAELTAEQRAHVEQAAQHLRKGGLNTLASQLEAALHEARQSAVQQELARKQTQLRALQQEIAALERQSEPVTMIALQFTLLEVNRDVLREADAALAQQVERWIVSPDAAVSRSDLSTPPLSMAQLLQRLREQTESGAVKLLSEPRVLTQDGQEVRVIAGGAYPIQVPAGPAEFFTEHLQFGTNVAVKPRLTRPGVVQCNAVHELSDLDFRQNVTGVDGKPVPRLNKRKVEVNFTAALGETMLIPGPASQGSLSLLFVTAERGDDGTPSSK